MTEELEEEEEVQRTRRLPERPEWTVCICVD